jgi:hypothetical protein
MRTALASVLPFVLVTVGLVGCARHEEFYVASAVDTTIQIAAASSAASAYQREVDAERQERAEAEGRRAYGEAADAAAVKNPKRRCTEVRVLVVPPPPPGTPALRGMDCNGRVLVQDAEGKWRDYDAVFPSAPAPAPAPAPAQDTP